MWDLIVSVPDHCLSFYFDTSLSVTCTERDKIKINFSKLMKRAMKLLFITNHTFECFIRVIS